MSREPSDERLMSGLKELAASTAALAAESDVSSRVMDQLEASGKGTKRSWTWALAPIALACALVLIWSMRGGAEEWTIDAADGVTLASSEGTRVVRGSALTATLPIRLLTGPAQRVLVTAGTTRLELAPESQISIAKRGELELASGAVSIVSNTKVELEVGASRIAGSGEFMAERQQGGRTMKVLRKHKVAASAAIVAVAVYTGWASLETAESRTEIVAPGGAYVDGDGKTRRFAVAGSRGDEIATAARAHGSSSVHGEGAAADSRASGAFWSNKSEVVEFRLHGEAIDADSGQPLTEFEISAVAVESHDYGQTKPKSWSLTDRADGSFELAGLGLGRWRITGRASGYAAVEQTVDLTEVSADPYLVIPFSEGAILSGRVVDWRGQPVGGAKVGLVDCFDTKKTTCELVETPSDGRFAVPGAPAEGGFAVRAEHPRFGTATARDLERSAVASEHVEMKLSGVARIFGEVTRGKEKEPVAGAAVVSAETRAQSDHNGLYEMLIPLAARPEAFVESFPNGPRTRAKVASYPDGRSAREVVWVDAPTHVAEVRVDFRLQIENARLFGRVTDAAGKPIAGAELDLANTTGWARGRGHETFPTYATTDREGRYSVEHIPASAGYRVSYRLSEEQEWMPLGYVNIMEEADVEANFSLGSAAIRGRFIDSESLEPIPLAGRACARLGAQLRGAGAEYFFMPHCYDDGRFEFSALPPGRYTLHNQVEWMSSAAEIEKLDLELGASQILSDVKIKVKGEASDTWRFRVLDDRGSFLNGVFLRIMSDNTTFTSGLSVGSNGTSTVSINRVYKNVFLDCPGYDSIEVRLEGKSSAEVHEVRLNRAAEDEGAD